MYSKSSTFLAVVSILAILAVLSIAIMGDNDTVAYRNPFPNSTRQTIKEKDTEEKNGQPTEINNQIEITKNGQIEYGISKEDQKKLLTDQVINNINNESLRTAGFSNFVIKPKPFEGLLFDRFDISMLGQANVTRKLITKLNRGNEVSILDVYEFHLTNEDGANELFEAIKLRIKSELSAKINQTNQFGRASFFINFTPVENNAFLVVKSKINVYALSYPKAIVANSTGKDENLQLVTKLLEGLN